MSSSIFARSARSCVPGLLALALAGTVLAGPPPAVELQPARVETTVEGDQVGIYSDRTLVVGVLVDRNEARVLNYTLKNRPHRKTLVRAGKTAVDPGMQQDLEVRLVGPGGTVYSRRVDVRNICLEHPAFSESHVAGDTFRLHQDAVIVELPEIAGFDSVEVLYHDPKEKFGEPRQLGRSRLDIDTFDPAGQSFRYRQLAFADESSQYAPLKAPLGSTPMWPEDFDDDQLYRVIGDEAESSQRINVVIVPDGYRYQDKALMDAHADNMIALFRGWTPHKEYDDFFNYILVYAYSAETATDECDCAIIRDTMMGMHYPNSTPTCGHSDNRCLQYGGGASACDSGGLSNIVASELRAPAHDVTLLMANTGRYGGCGGQRGTFSGAHSLAPGIAIHELGHTLAGLADEYGGDGCGAVASEINTSSNAIDGAWPEWIADIGAPKEGAQYRDECLYRPQQVCTMDWLQDPYCAVCKQRWSLEMFDHARIDATAPIRSATPEPVTSTGVNVVTSFSLNTRLPTGPGVTNDFNWYMNGPGFGGETLVFSGSPDFDYVFSQEGDYTLAAEVIGGTNFVKPSRTAQNRGTTHWLISVQSGPPAELEGPVQFFTNQLLLWDVLHNVSGYNVYRGEVSGLATGNYGNCLKAGLDQTESFYFDTETPPADVAWFYQITSTNALGEGTMGFRSDGSPRINSNPCE